MIVLMKLLTVITIILALVGGWLLTWASIPSKQETEVSVLAPSMMHMDQSGQADGSALLEYRQVKLKWPRSMRIGDVESIELTFEKATEASSLSSDDVVFEDVYKYNNLMGEARFEAAGLIHEPENPTRESMPRGRPIKFKWLVRSEKSGWYEGTVWLSLRYLPLDGSVPVQAPIYVREVMLHSTSLLGLSGPMARIVGSVGMFIGLGLVLIKRLTQRAQKTPRTQS